MRWIVFILIVFISCSSPKNRFEDKTLIKIADLQDRRSADSLVAFLYSDKDEYRRAAALAMGSVQDTTAIDTLGKPATRDLETRINTAWALGQMNNPGAVKALIYGEPGDEPKVQREILEAIGKVAKKEDLAVFFAEDSDPMRLEGAAWGNYRAGVRGVVDTTTINLALSLLDAPGPVALGGAHFFARTPFKSTPEIAKGLSSASTYPDPEIRMAVVSALAKVNPQEALDALTKAATDTDYRVRANAARGLRTQPWDVSKRFYELLLADSNVHVSVAAAEVINPLVPASDTTLLLDWARKAKNWRTQATLYECLLKLSLTAAANNEVRDLYKNSNNTYQQAALLTALSNNVHNGLFIFEQFKGSNVKLIKSTIANALVRINYAKNFPEDFTFVKIYQQIIEDGDQGAILYVCNALSDSTLKYKKLIKDYSFLERAKAKLSLPKDYETYVPLERALNYFKGLPPPPPLKNEYNHPIDWTLAATIGKDQKVVLETTKGKIVMQLFIEEAPGSVVNFVKLINDKYYDGKYFHRVVPNFVIQTGCDRGDGFGGLDYSIRSEFTTRKYKTGSVGMASAGKDTEGTQWFITHSPTPHLDGKYTIFAEVIEGMDVVHKIEVGDQIISARLANSN
ncbi:MAG TPA: peptidylprolyl isomerase [Cyclobacteriaceae bacterium]|nr:peptidylprolyl isomerase [Cyclobacteriaceae bacterium]